MKIEAFGNVKDFLGFKDIVEPKELNLEKKTSFGDFMIKSLNEVNNLQLESEELKRQLAVGELDNLHDLTIAMEKANVSLQLTSAIRNKITEAYKEIMRIQI